MMSRATAAPRSRSRRESERATVFSGVKSMMKKSGPARRPPPARRLNPQERPPHLEGETRRRAVVAEAAEHVVVATAPAERRPEAAHVPFAVHPGVVVEAADLPQVQDHRVREPVGPEQPVDLAEVRTRAIGA